MLFTRINRSFVAGHVCRIKRAAQTQKKKKGESGRERPEVVCSRSFIECDICRRGCEKISSLSAYWVSAGKSAKFGADSALRYRCAAMTFNKFAEKLTRALPRSVSGAPRLLFSPPPFSFGV